MACSDVEFIDVSGERVVGDSRRLVRRLMERAGFSTMEITRVVTASSELARNMVRYAGGGRIGVEVIHEATRTGVRVMFEDHGPGIRDIAEAMRDGYSTGGGLGVGLPGAARLVDSFEIESHPGLGTRIEIRKWKR
jgi:serine/threonine-protein kinase RsbT